MDRSTLERKSVDDLREIAKQLDLTGVGRLRKAELIDTIVGEIDDSGGSDEGSGGADEAGNEQRRRDEVIERRRSRSRNGQRQNDGDDGDDEASSDDASSDDEASSDDASSDSDQDRPRARSRDRRQRSGRGGRSDLDGLEEREGVLDLLPEGYGFLRTTGYVSGARDVYVSQSYVRRFNLRRGDLLGGPVRFNKGNDKFPALARLETCEGEVVENEHDPLLRDRPDFADLGASYPTEQLVLGDDDAPVLLHALDAVAPIGLGQRALVLGPSDADNRAVAAAVAEALQHRTASLVVGLFDAPPEEIDAVADAVDAEVVGTPLDAPAEDHVAAAELVVERAKRLVERGQDVVVVLDSLTRLGRAYSLAASGSSRSLPGGIDPSAIAPLKQLFGAARNVDGEGSLTVVATAGLDPDSEADRTIVDHLRGAGNAEVRVDPTLGLDDGLPGLDLARSGTRRAELLVGDGAAAEAAAARAAAAARSPRDAWQQVVGALADGGDLAAVTKALTA